MMTKYIRAFIFSIFLLPCASMAAGNDFMVAAQLLSAARNGDIQQVQILVNNGADVNFVDSTGLSVVCTALMNNDVRAAQILQMYGADASKCDQQIKKYNSKNKTKERSGGLFSGLSSAHNLTLAAAGAAVVVGGLLLLTDVFDFGGGGSSGGSGSNRPNNGNADGGNNGSVTADITLPYGPAMPNAESESANYVTNLNYYSPNTDEDSRKAIFEAMNGAGQNYLLMMHGYSPLARGYLGMQTLRKTGDLPASLSDVNPIGTVEVTGGKPIGVGLVTANGVNAAMKPSTDATAQQSSLDDKLLAWTTIGGNVVVSNPETGNLVSRYYNNSVVLGDSSAPTGTAYTVENKSALAGFDLAGWGTAVSNTSASELDDLLAKIVGGGITGFEGRDYIGFVPNAQMGIFRTGGGYGMKKVTDGNTGEYTMTDGKLATITLFGKNLTVTMEDDNQFKATVDDEEYVGYLGVNGYLYIAATPNGAVSQAYSMDDNKLTQIGQADDVDYYNYHALMVAAQAWHPRSRNGATGAMDIIANASVIEPLHATDAKTIESIQGSLTESKFSEFVDLYYDRDKEDGTGGTDNKPSVAAITFFDALGSGYSPLVVFSTGAAQQSDSTHSDAALKATFENAAPLVFSNLQHLFMSVVAVRMNGNGTTKTTRVSEYTPGGKLELAWWRQPDNTTDPVEYTYYKARVCDVAGSGSIGLDPWCFAATGLTDEMAVASAAGAAAAVKSAFSYLTNKEVFTLLALTADGPYLGTMTDRTPLTKDDLRVYLKTLYDLPPEYEFRWENGIADYLDVFKEVFGYGLINLERATKPGSSIYVYSPGSGRIVTASGTAYWRAASQTRFRTSSAFSPRISSISAPFFDVLESVDGEMRLPRIWENEFEIGARRQRGLYLNDVFGDLKTRDVPTSSVQMGNLSFSMTTSSRPYVDNMGGLDSLHLGMRRGAWDVAAGYQHNFTDGAGAFSGMANPIMSLAHDAVTSDVQYNVGGWTFGGRVFSGAITDNELLENDPTITSQYTPARLGLMHGGAFSAGWGDKKLRLGASVGMARETETILGAQTGGLLNLGGGDTSYIDVHGRYLLGEDVSVSARATFARTTADSAGPYIMGLSAIDSNAFALGLNVGGFEVVASQPLAVRKGHLSYAYADYSVVETDDNRFDIVANELSIRHAGMRPVHRETRLAAQYRHPLGEFTDGALGLIYRMNPNNTDEFGNETVLMLKLSHRLGI